MARDTITYAELAEAIRRDKQERPFAYVGMIIYPINGRAEGITPIGHYAGSRNAIISEVAQELEEQEPSAFEDGMKLLRSGYDLVRVGRIVVQILKYRRDMPSTRGSAPLEAAS